MIAEPTRLPEVVLFRPKVYMDERGFFLETFNTRALGGTNVPETFVQDNHSRSSAGVIRGLHYQLDNPQGKLVHVARGRIFDVAVDIRRGSPTFGEWQGVELSDDNLFSLWIPPGFAHGFCVTSDVADVIYKCTSHYDPADDRGVLWSDPRVGVKWPAEAPTVSPKDALYRGLEASRDDLPRYG
ncbi:MAG: dTDP-4-dehydrorhamnose 3,5-epimerase [Gemmatimonadaceae bacterium]|nr:dTDP-4-dehydrorhamnose 3,5-epimerase [Gemmatimonadaceae bacterium]MDQ3243281.1 dTDP-4-dehydrorhamnose 3,5-epimerase [Gemmatimonadota bacterium]